MANYRVKGPAVAAVGWIPYSATVSSLPAPHVYAPNLAMRLLFNSGNPPPPDSFSDPDGFRRWRLEQEFRGLLYLSETTIEWSDEDPRPRLLFRPPRDFGETGYTPPRFVVTGIDATPPPARDRYIRGIGGPEPERVARLPEMGGFAVRFRVRFKLSYKIDVMGRLITGYWAPYAWMEVVYRIEKSGAVRLSFDGSTVPSQNYYVGRELKGQHDMLKNSDLEFRSFLETEDYCIKAPRRGVPFEYEVQCPVVVE